MIISPQDYVKQFKNSTLEECIDVRDSLFEKIREFEKEPDYTDDIFPSALTMYMVSLDYLKELNDVISTKIRSNNPQYAKNSVSAIELRKCGITDTGAEAIVNAANEYLRAGSGVCGAIFKAAGSEKLQEECESIGHCDTGDAVMTSGYELCDYIIHAVGPIYDGGRSREAELLYSCYRRSLDLAKENGIKRIAFPLISSGIYGYPKEDAWRKALQACSEWIESNPDHQIYIVFAIIDDQVLNLGKKIAEELNIRTV